MISVGFVLLLCFCCFVTGAVVGILAERTDKEDEHDDESRV